MAGTLVGGALLSGFINVVFDRLLSPQAASLIGGKKLDQELVERLKTALCAAEALLVDAERKQMENSSVKNWLDSLRDAIYVADDLLDKFFTEAATGKEVSTFLPRFLNTRDRKMVSMIEGIVRRIEDIEKRKYILGLKEVPVGNLSWRTPSTSLVKGNVYGREDDQEAIIKIFNDHSEDQLSVFPIVGMGGVGKTTLAQWVYNNEDLMKGFDLKVWVCVSEEFDVVEITKTIIEGITSGTCNFKDLNLLQLKLKEKLVRKKFFIVLDDVWSDDGHSWSNFKTPFQYGAKGSKVLVTTRSKEVASVVQTCPAYFLNELSEDLCWSVFADNACFPESNGDSTLEEIGRKIVKKCKGLPLAAETLGRLLRTKHDVEEWNVVLMSDIWEFSVKNSKIIPALLISYYHLPPHLKRCFAYCSLFPKDYRFDKGELILLWMAEDLLQPVKRGETLEEVGCECFDDLASRLIFKQFGTSGSFVMHDLLHDLAIFVAGDFYFRLKELSKSDETSIGIRHLSYENLSHPSSKHIDSMDKLKSLRTLLHINLLVPSSSFNIGNTTCVILTKLKYLRVLSFRSCFELDVLPDSICELIHLRYLDMSETSVQTLPESLNNLYNLQTLKLCGCRMLTMLPNNMQRLVNLRHLDIKGTSLKEMPRGISKLKHLHHLSYFIVGRHEENGIRELGDLSTLHGTLEIRKLENVSNSGEAVEARIMNKIYIENLHLQWSSSGVDTVQNTQTERDIVDKLQPHKGMKLLTIKGYRGTRFPNWIGHSSYHNMTRISLEFCNSCCMLPSLGQLPSLKSLLIRNFNGLESIGAEFYKNGDDDYSSLATPFPSLVDLSFYGLSCWEVWHSFESNAFPQLKFLRIIDCPRLMGDLPNHLPMLETLEIDGCEQLVSALTEAPAIRNLLISQSSKIRLQELPLSLESLSIRGCQMTESMFQANIINRLTCLQSLSISDCSSSISFPGDCLPEPLKTLEIKDCRKLEFPKQRQKHELLVSLEIHNSCDSLTLFQMEVFPNLMILEITECENLETISLSQSQHAALDTLIIHGCHNFVLFSSDGLAAPNMTDFWIFRCFKLKSLPSKMNTLLPKLEYFTLSHCPEIDSFPEGGLPPNLRTLEVIHCEKLLSSLSSIGRHEGLTELVISGASEDLKSFPKQDSLPQLPSLTSLQLSEFSSMETLDCNGLVHFTSLEELTIADCPKLKNIVGERLPHSLSELQISRCPLLEQQCKVKHPQIWPKISHIRGIQVTGRWVS